MHPNKNQPYYDASGNNGHPPTQHNPPTYNPAPAKSYGAPLPVDQKHHYNPQTNLIYQPAPVSHQMDQKRPLYPPAQAPVPQAAPPIYSASGRPGPDGRRLLHIYHQGWTHRHTQVMDSDKTTPIYTINSNSGGMFSSKPHMTILNAATGAIAGTVTFHQMSSTIDLEIHGRPIAFDKPGVFTSAHEFRSLATGQLFKWKRDGVFSGGDLKCIDQQDQMVANFENSAWSMKKDGKFEIGPMVQGPFMDEVLISGIAAMEYQRRQNNASSSGGGGGG